MKLGTHKDLLKIILFVVVFYVPTLLFVLDRTKVDNFEKIEIEAEASLQSIGGILNTLIFAGQFEKICSHLEAEARVERLVLFYYQDKKTKCASPSNLDPSVFPSTQLDSVLRAETEHGDIKFIRSQDAESGAQFIIANHVPQGTSFLKETIWNPEMVKTLLGDITLVIWLLLGFFIIFVAINLNRIKRLYGNSSQLPGLFKIFEKVFGWLAFDDFKSVETASLENLKLLRKLEEESQYQETNLKYSVIGELREQARSGIKINFPYKFIGITVRVDINGYSQLMQSMPLATIREINTSFKEIAGELAYRYGGLFENSAGDEVVYCFKDSNSLLKAVAFVRDLMHEFGNMVFHDEKGDGFRLFVKGSIDRSEMLMDMGSARLEFDGMSLLYTNRMFGELKIKDKNVLIVRPEICGELENLCLVPEEIIEIHSKGMKISVKYITEFIDQTSDLKKLANNSLFQSDRFIIRFLDAVEYRSLVIDFEVSYLTQLPRLKKSGSAVKSAWKQALMRIRENKDKVQDPYLMPTMIALGPDLILQGDWDEECTQLVRAISYEQGSRTAENAIETLIRVGHTEDFNDQTGRLGFLASDEKISDRMKANILVARVLSSPTEESFAALRKMAESSVESTRISGIYAASMAVELLSQFSDRGFSLLNEYRKVLNLLERTYRKIKKGKLELSPRVEKKISKVISKELL